jgi:3-hydroxybutyryl-CoA dehydrogenase
MPAIAVVGAGVMGVDVACTLSFHGYDVLLKDVNPSALAEAPELIQRNIRMYSMMSPALRNWSATEILSRIVLTDNYERFADVQWVIENVTEDLETKSAVYRELSKVCRADARYAVNTSCLSITKLASLMPHPENVIGMHFMNPVPLKEIVETVRGFHTSPETVQASEDFLHSLRKTAILVEDSPGFVANRLSHLFMNEAAFLVQEKVAPPEQIDRLFRKGYAHKMGPLETADLIGLDTVVRSLKVLYESFQDPKFKCCPLLAKMVDAGLLGRKSGQGFYTY